jgi:pilus assembly protein CpaC
LLIERKVSNSIILFLLLAATSIAVAQQPTGGAAPTQQPATGGASPGTTSAPPQANAPSGQEIPSVQAQPSSEPQTLRLLVGRSLVINTPGRIKRISLADPEIAEAVVISPTQVLVNAKRPGGVSLVMWDEANQNQAFEIFVSMDVLSLSQKIHDVFPSENIRLDSAGDSVVLSGPVSSAAVADRILAVVKSATPKVISMLDVPPEQTSEILLQVRFAEVDRSAVNQFGINLISLPGAKNIGTISTQQFSPPQLAGSSSGVGSAIGLSDLLNIFISRPDINFAATIKALETQNLLQILAEPNLVTESGKEASFLAGGEFPYPVPQVSAGGAGSTITIQFKEFGVRLTFTPVYTADGLIHLKVKPEVSSLDYTNAVTLQGFLIPAISTRRVESDMELRDGQSFAIAGLMDNTITNSMEKIPWISDIPILGKLFQSHSYNKSKTELLVVVTPRIVKPLLPEQVPHGPQFPVPFLDSEKPKESGKK